MGTRDWLRIEERIEAGRNAARRFDGSKFSLPSTFRSYWLKATICEFDGHEPVAGQPHHIPICSICGCMVFHNDLLREGWLYPKALKCTEPDCWHCRILVVHPLKAALSASGTLEGEE